MSDHAEPIGMDHVELDRLARHVRGELDLGPEELRHVERCAECLDRWRVLGLLAIHYDNEQEAIAHGLRPTAAAGAHSAELPRRTAPKPGSIVPRRWLAVAAGLAAVAATLLLWLPGERPGTPKGDGGGGASAAFPMELGLAVDDGGRLAQRASVPLSPGLAGVRVGPGEPVVPVLHAPGVPAPDAGGLLVVVSDGGLVTSRPVPAPQPHPRSPEDFVLLEQPVEPLVDDPGTYTVYVLLSRSPLSMEEIRARAGALGGTPAPRGPFWPGERDVGEAARWEGRLTVAVGP